MVLTWLGWAWPGPAGAHLGAPPPGLPDALQVQFAVQVRCHSACVGMNEFRWWVQVSMCNFMRLKQKRHQTKWFEKQRLFLSDFFNSKPLSMFLLHHTKSQTQFFPTDRMMEESNSRGQRSKTGVNYHLAAEKQNICKII